MQIYHAEWKLVTHVNLSHFSDELKHLENILLSINNICTRCEQHIKIMQDVSCREIIVQAKNMIEDSKEYSSKWFVQSDTEKKSQELKEE